ncbi:long-chain-fatty-acid--CoA ligase [Croceicoccus mobilis]|uniref:Dicarboxylate--CoA ligase PimA n=1 Tax=Croceicoccus mobilis TaxID=1703339 RepID=A0A917DPZ4_9SPHN|nr:long-chain fatty acid--CoA ligase [Croceicoccus mobilis]GGD59854.1 dicarboxylate--CoA ligase PimA [Croceicoccus mobilis]
MRESEIPAQWPFAGDARLDGEGHYSHAIPWESEFEPLSVPQLYTRGAELAGSKNVVDFLGKRLSYPDAMGEARQIAAALQRAGVGKGDRIGLFLPNVPLYLTAYYGIMIAGATAVNFSPLYTVDELAAQVADSGVETLFTINSSLLLPTACKVLDCSGLERLVVGDLPSMMPWWMGAAMKLFKRSDLAPLPRDPRIVAYDRFVSGAGEPQPVAIDPHQDVALLIYTGGTTGRPKGAMLTHQNITANARQTLCIDAHRGERDIMIGVLPLFHVFANVVVLNRTVLDGGTIVMLPRFDAKQCLKALGRVRATSMPGVPTMYQALLDHPQVEKTDFTSLRVCISGGAPLPLPLKRKFEAKTGAHVIEGYGLTEAGIVSTNPFGDFALEKPGTIGQPLPGTQVRLLNKEDPTRLADPGTPGELAVKGPQVMKGYWNRPEGNAIFQDGWLRTGDVATLDEDGFLTIVDRIKDMISVGGFKVFPSQIEEVLVARPGIREALVLGIPDDYMGERPKAFVTLEDECDDGEDALLQWINARVGKHERLAALEIREELPKTMIGKPDRKALRAEIAEASDTAKARQDDPPGSHEIAG